MKFLFVFLLLIPYSASAVRITTTIEGNQGGGGNAGGGAFSGTASAISAGASANTQHIDRMQSRADQQRAGIQSEANRYHQATAAVHSEALKLESAPIEEKSIEAYLPTTTPSRPAVDLASIPDPVTIPYEFKSQGGNREELLTIYKNLYKAEPKFGKLQKARELGLSSAQFADEAYAEGNDQDGRFYKDLAQGFLDLVVGLDPVTGMARSAWELCYGRNFITGATLSSVERGVAFLGVITAGSSKSATNSARALSKLYHAIPGLLKERSAIQAGIREGEALGAKASQVIRGWRKNHRITHIETATEANARLKLNSPPFQEGTHVVRFETIGESKFVRVHGETNAARPWMVRKGEIKGLTPEQIRDKLNLPELPTHVSEIVVPGKTPMSRGMTQYNQWEYVGEKLEGQVQYRVEGKVFDDWIKNTRKIGKIYE